MKAVKIEIGQNPEWPTLTYYTVTLKSIGEMLGQGSRRTVAEARKAADKVIEEYKTSRKNGAA